MKLEVPVAVVGAGAAGLMAAIAAATHGAKVTVLEGTERVGTKILMSGGTRCNVTHDFVSDADYFGGSRNVTKRLLRDSQRVDLPVALELASSLQALVQHTKDQQEAVLAFNEKRKPKFEGR